MYTARNGSTQVQNAVLLLAHQQVLQSKLWSCYI
jgi:hypothetical protein